MTRGLSIFVIESARRRLFSASSKKLTKKVEQFRSRNSQGCLICRRKCSISHVYSQHHKMCINSVKLWDATLATFSLQFCLSFFILITSTLGLLNNEIIYELQIDYLLYFWWMFNRIYTSCFHAFIFMQEKMHRCFSYSRVHARGIVYAQQPA